MPQQTQKTAILAHLRNRNKLTPIEALEQFGCFRLAAVVHVLNKEGHNIKTEIINDKVTGKKYAKYELV